MRKLFTLIFALALIFTFTGLAMADPNAEGGPGEYTIGAGSFGGGCGGDLAILPRYSGGAGGISGAGGLAGAGADGDIYDGTASGYVNTEAGGLTDTDAYRLNNPVPTADKSIGVGSASSNYAVTGATADIYVDPNGLGVLFFGDIGTGFIPFTSAGGLADAHIFGIAGQGTLNGSYVGDSPLLGWESEGFSGGIAGQGSLGGFCGYAYITAGPDYGVWYYGDYIVPLNRPIDSFAGAAIGARIDMWGNSYSDSYRSMNDNGGLHTEGIGTNVGAFTNVVSSGYANTDTDYIGTAYANVNGGWVAGGFAATATVQNAPGIGGAGAYAAGSYCGSGPLNTNYTGSATGYSATSVTTATGMNGSINTANAGMSVTSVVH